MNMKNVVATINDGVAGLTSMFVKIDNSSPLSFTAEIAYTGITDNYDYAQMFVYGVPGATAIQICGHSDGMTAVGVTGQVAVIGGPAATPVRIAGTGDSGHVGVTGQVKVLAGAASLPVAGTGPSGHVGVTGEVTVKGVATNVAIPITGGVFAHGLGVGATAMPVLATPPDGGGMTSESVSASDAGPPLDPLIFTPKSPSGPGTAQ